MKRNEREKRRQSINHLFLPWFVLQEYVLTQRYNVRRTCSRRCCGGPCYRHRHHHHNSHPGMPTGDDDFRSELSYQEEKVRQLHRREFAARMMANDTEHGGLPSWQEGQQQQQQQQQQQPGHKQVQRRLSWRKSSFSLPHDSSQLSEEVVGGDSSTRTTTGVEGEGGGCGVVGGDGDGDGNIPSDRDSITSVARSVATVEYKIRTDPRQHDKAIEIILCSIERPHMRAFHGSWFGFFIGFIMWYVFFAPFLI